MVLPEPETERYRLIDQYDLGQATMAMMLAATDLGIGSGHSAVGDQEACRRILGVPSDRHGAYMLALGYPADHPVTTVEGTRTSSRLTRSSTAADGRTEPMLRGGAAAARRLDHINHRRLRRPVHK